MAMTLGSISEFQISIKRHLEESKKLWIESGSRTASILGTSARIACEEMPTDYLDALADLSDKISAFLEAPVIDLDSLVLLSPVLLWMIPAFCFSSQFLDPHDAHAKCIAIQNTRSTHQMNFTDDIWDKDLVHDWAGSDDSYLLLLQGNSETTKRFERFAVEIIHALRSGQALQPVRLVYILNTPRPAEDPSQLTPSDLLQQVVVQCLQYVSPIGPVSFLINMFGRFKKAATGQDWFCILQDICLLIPSLYIIIDLSALGRNYEQTQLWPGYFQDLFNSLKSSKLRRHLKVMLLCCRRLTSHVGETLVISPKPARSALVRNRHRTSKLLRTIATDPTDTSADSSENIEAFHIPRGPCLNPDSSLMGERFGQVYPTNPRQSLDAAQVHIGSSSLPEPQNRNDFKIAIICALCLESNAVENVFDRRWDEIKHGRSPGDRNHYTMGTIGQHHVVLVHMARMGKINGASVASNCRASFPNIGLVLVVGICGGVPFTKGGTEIILGDVIVSEDLIEYDHGRQFSDRFVRKCNSIPKPDTEIMAFLSKMKIDWHMKILRERTILHLERLSGAAEQRKTVQYPGPLRDRLYEPNYRHKHQTASDCEICNLCRTRMDSVCEDALTLDCKTLQCDDKHLVARRRLVVVSNESNVQQIHAGPSIHFGTYASGDRVMKSGEERDNLAEDEGVIAFEMEGSGILETFPGRCLVIKAVCDYADSHKNKEWQPYAAASAAACTKAFLQSWYPQLVEESPR